MTTTAEDKTRRVRPWIAALLTFLGWGVGFYYARRTRAAVWWAIAGVLLGVVLGLALALYLFYARTAPPGLLGRNDSWSLLDFVGLGLTTVVAVTAWVVTARQKTVERGGPARLLGYVAIAVLPFAVSLLLGLTLRFTTVQPFRAPAGSMQPAIHVGDYFVVTKWSYGYSRYSFAPFEGLLPEGRLYGRAPARGDIVVFRPVPEPDRDFVKRLIGLPGDRIQMIDGVLHINGEPVQRESLGVTEFENEDGLVERVPAYRETLPNGVSYTTFDRTPRSELDNTRVFVVPAGRYFMMGDDRDNSADSRVPSMVGYVPYDNLIGRVDFITRSTQ